ncbi:NAD-dependent epimerase/dehydratase family protein [Gemmata sp. G18]|uniref:NAD-dependent epimerase/dehydratase family protein n=1 Tax=Gemmata palustris TaxID=2822762 RepID=A0ABS5BRD5_9BACT|nr:NAD-dependent epimerase/dehydratase family protein [Gemmata palustris]MBP3956216.1 NAD-dependent epimerase/dehydratase family protein [Gemmata palustris]
MTAPHNTTVYPTWTGRRVALTGATGFVGWHLASALRAAGAEVVALHREGSDTARLQSIGVRTAVAPLIDAGALAAGCRGADVLVHAAAAVDFGGDREAIRQVNVEGTRTVIQAARAAGVRRVVHLSSVAAVGATRWPDVRDESAPWTLGAFDVPYATTKRDAELMALAANDDGLEVVVVNPGCVVGPDDFGESEFGALCKRFWRGRVPFHFTGGNTFVDVRDVAAGVMAAATRGRPGERYLLTGENRRWQGFFQDLARAAGRPIPRATFPGWLALPVARVMAWRGHKKKRRPPLSIDSAKFVGLYFFYTAEKARRELGFAPRPLRESLADAFAFWHGPGQLAPRKKAA